MKKRLFCFLLSVALCFSVALPVFANDSIYSLQPTVFQTEGDAYAVLKNDNSLWAWGCNSKGGVGNGNGFEDYYDFANTKWIRAYVDTPYKVLDDVKYYDGGTWAIKNDDSLWVWGSTAVILGLTDNALTAVPQKYMDNVRSFSYGENPDKGYEDWADETILEKEFNFYVVKTDGTLIGWGINANGELGDGTTERRTTPITIMDGVRSVQYVEGEWGNTDPFTSYGHIFVIKEDDSLWGWGADAAKMQNRNWGNFIPTPIKHLDNVKSISTTKCTTAALTNDGGLYIWGEIPKYVEGASSSSPIYYVKDFYHVADRVREVHLPTILDIIYVTTGNEVYRWDSNTDGYTPTKIMDNVATMAVSGDSSYICKTNGELWNYSSETPQKMLDGVSAVFYHIQWYAVKTDGSLWGCGYDGRHALMGKAGGKRSDSFIKLMDGAKLSYAVQYTELLQKSAE